jgi:nicotinate-nucleotide--dimethylbenzimidazole phosphoribosyltransferase
MRIGPGTANIAAQRAMSREDAIAALVAGVSLSRELAAQSVGIIGLGEMGIANTTAAAAVVSALLDVDARDVCGRGTGIDDRTLARKVGVVRRALRRHAPVEVLAAVGGFEIGLLAGLALGGAAERVVVLVDGFVASAAALIAAQLAPDARQVMIAAHRSPEPGHAVALAALGLEPLLDLGLRLGEGTGVALALPVVQASLAIVADMATFAGAGVTDTGR